MEQHDPLETRRRGIRRVRVVTASLAGAALVGTGALVLVVAEQQPAAAATAVTPQAPADDDRADQPADLFGGPPSTGLGQAPAGGGSHASSGGS